MFVEVMLNSSGMKLLSLERKLVVDDIYEISNGTRRLKTLNKHLRADYVLHMDQAKSNEDKAVEGRLYPAAFRERLE